MSASSVDSGGGGGGGGDGGSGCGGGGRGVGSSGGGGCCVGSGGDGGRHGGAPPPSPRSECSPLSAADAAALTAVWTSTSCGELVAGQVPVVIPSDATVHDACELLAAHSILSAPVRSADGTGYAGVCTYRSLVKYVLEVFPSRGAGGRESPRPPLPPSLPKRLGRSDARRRPVCAAALVRDAAGVLNVDACCAAAFRRARAAAAA